MSFWAIAEGEDIERTATEFRRQFLEYGVKHEKFGCPECGVRVYAVIVYSEDIANSKTPYFRESKTEPHRSFCPYNHIKAQNAKEEAKRHFERMPIHIPTVLSAPKNTNHHRSSGGHHNVSREVKSTDQSGSLGRAQCRVSQIRDIVIVWNEYRRKIFTDNNNEKLSVRGKWKIFNDKMSELPISLYRFQTNFKTAFSDTYFPPPKYSRIFWGKAVVEKTPKAFILNVEKQVHEIDGNEIPVNIEIPFESFNDFQYQWKSKMYEQLDRASINGNKIEWFAYGVLRKFPERYLLVVDDIRHYFMKSTRFPSIS